ncbi:MAG TPA: fumarylacetoacetate hydrolase family protein, partial [Burkholderiales bacterium]|nr:fumarylacetoacetate hydrolase family protein [Burkholderiales bacterium]
LDGTCPMGPWLVTKDEIPNPHGLRLTSRVNREIKQDSNTQFMYFKVPRIIAELSAGLTLEPGDIISTGTPAGVAAGRKPHETPWYLRPGDVIECEVGGVGLLRNRIVEDPSAAASWDWAA